MYDPNVVPWFDTRTAILYGAIGGSACGVLGGVVGTLAGRLAPQGKGRGLILGLMYLGLVFGVANLALGVIAVTQHQPYAIWYPFVLLGVILTLVFGLLLPMVKRVYAQVELRKIEADKLRQHS